MRDGARTEGRERAGEPPQTAGEGGPSPPIGHRTRVVTGALQRMCPSHFIPSFREESMSESISPKTFERFVAVDLHKDYVVVAGVSARLEVVLSPGRTELAAWPRWAKAHLN